MGAYRNPEVKGVNFNVIDKAAVDGLANVGEATASIAKQKAEAYAKLEAKHAQYLEDTFLERAKGMDEAQHRAIQESVQMNIVDFSNLSGMEKANNLNAVKEIKQTQESLEAIVTDVSDKNRILNKGLDKKYYEFFEDLSSMNSENIEYIPSKDGLGFTIKHTNNDGEVNTFNQSQIITMSAMTGDVSGTLDEIDENISSVVGIISEERDAFAEAQQIDKWDEDVAFEDTYQTFQKIGKEKMAIYFSEYVSPYEEIAPKTDENGNPLSEEETAKRYEENVDKTINHMINTAKEEVRRTAKKKPYYKPTTPRPESSAAAAKTAQRQAEIDYATKFKRDFALFQRNPQNVDILSEYLASERMFAEVDGDELVIYRQDTSIDDKTETVSVGEDKFSTGKKVSSDDTTVVYREDISNAAAINNFMMSTKAFPGATQLINPLTNVSTEFLNQLDAPNYNQNKFNPEDLFLKSRELNPVNSDLAPEEVTIGGLQFK